MALDLFELVLRVTSEGIEKAKRDLEGVSKAGGKVAEASKAQQKEIAKSTQMLSQLASLVDKNDKHAIANLQRLASAQKDWAAQIGASTGQLLKIEQVEKRIASIGRTSEHSSGGVRKLGNAFERLASDALGVNPVISKISTTLGEFALGGLVTVGVLAGLAAIGLAYERLTRSSREYKNHLDDVVKSLNAQTKAAFEATRAGQQQIIADAKAAVALAERRAQVAGAASSGRLGLGALIGSVVMDDETKATKELTAARSALAQATKNLKEFEAERTENIREKGLASDRAMLEFTEGAAAIFKKIDEDNKKRLADEQRRFDERIKLLSQAIIYDDLREKAASELGKLEDFLSNAIARGNLSLERRLDLEEKLAVVRQAAADAARISAQQQRPTSPGDLIGLTPDKTPLPSTGGPLATIPESKIPKLPEVINESGRVAVEAMNKLQADMNNAIASLSQVLGDGIYEAFAAAFNGEGIGGIFKAFTKTVLAGIGQIFTMMGQAYLEYGVIMSGLVPTLSNPFTAGPTAIAIGALLVALGGALGAISKGAGRGTAGAGAFREPRNGTSDVVRLKFVDRPNMGGNLSPVQPVVINAYGPNDPRTQRWMLETFNKATRR